MPTRPITGPLTRSLSGGVTGVGVGGFSVGSLFSSGQDGGVYEWGDLSTVYQDAAGTTAGVAGQANGLTLDKRLGLVRGVEKIPHPYWTGGYTTSGTKQIPAGWTQYTPANVSAATVAANSYQFTATAHLAGIELPVETFGLVGKWVEYTIRARKTALVSGTPTLNLYSGVWHEIVPSAAAIGTWYEKTIRAACTNTIIISSFNSSASWEVEFVSAKELPGNHATQATTANKPTLQLGYAAFDRFDDFMTASTGGGGTTGILLCAGIRAGGAGSARTIWSDLGTNAGYRLSLNASNQLELSAGNGTAFTTASGPTITAGTDYVVQGWHDGANLRVRVGLAAATSAAFGTATAGTAGFTIGRDNGTASGLYGDRIYGLIYRKNDASTAAERDNLARYMASKSNVTL